MDEEAVVGGVEQVEDVPGAITMLLLFGQFDVLRLVGVGV